MMCSNLFYRNVLIVIFLSNYTVLIAAKNDCECGKASDTMVSMRIVGGRRAAPHSFPWTVAIVKHNKMHCGGALITDQHILSAGHCFQWDNVDELEVLLGLDNHDSLSDVERRKISSAKIHENFTSTAIRDDNDIAVATLSTSVPFDDKIIPICLPKPGEKFDNFAGTIVGWGRMGVNRSSSKVLLKATLKILPQSQCYESKLSEHLTDAMICAFSKGRDGCQGDSGGPLLVLQPSSDRYVQAGIVSWGIGCADTRYPGVYTEVSDYIDWINMHTIGGKKCGQ